MVWQAPYSDVVDQAVAVCYNSSQDTYVVPIAATNPNSPYDVFFEDLAVLAPYMRPFPVSGAGNVTVGNSVALDVLLAFETGGTTLQQFLASKLDANATLVFSGHSLGGGLTPLLAYALYPTGTSGSGWKAVYTYPTAGPTTADAGFATAFNAAFPIVPGNGYQMWNANQYNAHDIVPNAWSNASAAPSLAQITSGIFSWTSAMFYTDLTMSGEVAVLRTIAQALATGSGGTNPYTAPNANPLFTGARQEGQITSNTLLAEEILYQHTVAYSEAFGVTALFSGDKLTATIQPPLLALVRSVAGTSDAAATARAEAAESLESAD